MPLIHEEVAVQKTVGFVCNKCEKRFTDELDLQECFYKHDVGGYGSAFGDGVEYEIVLCSKCAFELLGDYAECQYCDG